MLFFISTRDLRDASADRCEISHGDQYYAKFYNAGPKFWGGGSLPKNFTGQKTCNIWPDFGWLQSSAANISGTDEDIRNRTSTFCTAIFPTLDEKSLVNFGPLITKIKQ